MKKWKFTWGTGVAIVLSLFILSMAYTMYKASQQRFDLVTTDYYQAELTYQETIERKEKAMSLQEDCKLLFKDGRLVLQFPEQLEGRKSTAKVLMYCLADARNDFTLNQEDWPVKDVTLPSGKLSPGKWIAKITLDTEHEKYYFEPSVVVP